MSPDDTLVTLAVGASPERDPRQAIEAVGNERYRDLGRLGVGGMAEVRRVWDAHLERTVAMKILAKALDDDARARFEDEARASAQLQHPNLVPVYDRGIDPDGRPWFTMREIDGRTLHDLVREVHQASHGTWATSATGWTLRRLVRALETVCRAVGYAHEQGVVHRDLKPNNIMVGSLGEIHVLDWGVASRIEAAGSTSARSSVLGTPAFMAPEQARGATVDTRVDVYALGAILYTLLRGSPPFAGKAPAKVLERLRQGATPVVGHDPSLPLPSTLVAICEQALAPDPDDRFPTSLALGEALSDWLEGVKRREEARALVRQTLRKVQDAADADALATTRTRQGEALLAGLERWRPEQDKQAAWALLAEAETLARQAVLQQAEVDRGLHAALQIVPTLPEAHAALAERLQERHAKAEAQRDPSALQVLELDLRTHLAALPTDHPTHQACARYLTGTGALTLVTEPAGAKVALYRYHERHRRLVEVFERDLGHTPLHEVPLAMGTYVCVLSRAGHQDVRVPVEVPRLGHATHVRPGDHEPTPIWLPPAGHFGPDELYVPAGWFRSGGDDEAYRSHPARRLWCDALVFQRFPVTNRAYLVFLHDLVDRGREGEALEHAPRARSATEGVPGELLYGRTSSGGFELKVDADGDRWHPDWPVFHLDWHGAKAYLDWLAARTGRPWRLPGELEWEKAARGVDGRRYPWGDHLDPSWCCMTDSHAERMLPVTVDTYPTDCSPYGVRGLGGNVRDWCADDEGRVLDGIVQQPVGGLAADVPRAVRGGSYYDNPRNARSANRDRNVTGFRVPLNGFRGVYTPIEASSRIPGDPLE